ncbi:MAG TPA: HD domain-containing protein [Opitutaceae bacterium]|jgi:putative hydrolase of HD superfamily
MISARLEQQIRFIIEVDALKDIFRQTQNIRSRRDENDAEHSWHLCLTAVVLAEHASDPRLDLLKVLRMVIIHDIVEIDAGDTPAYSDPTQIATQHEREERAADRIFGLLPADQAREFRGIWDEFEERRTTEAKFAHAVDRFQPLLLNWKTDGASWKKFDVEKARVLKRMAPLTDGAPGLVEAMEAIVEDSIAKGFLRRGP